MRLTVFGATGGTGRLVVEGALERGHEVTAVCRDPGSFALTTGGEASGPRHGRLEIRKGDVLDLALVEASVKGRDAVISAIGTGLHLRPTTLYSEGTGNVVRAMEGRGVGRFVLVSSAGLNVRDPAFPWWYRLLLKPLVLDRAKYGDMALMEEEVRESDLDWTVVRASRLTDGPPTGRYRLREGRLPEGGTRLSRADLAHFMLDQLAASAGVGKTPTLAY